MWCCECDCVACETLITSHLRSNFDTELQCPTITDTHQPGGLYTRRGTARNVKCARHTTPLLHPSAIATHRVAAAATPSVHCTTSAAAIPWRGLPPRGRAPPPGRYHRPTRHSASTPRPYVVAAPSPVCTSRLKAHFCRSLSSTNVCTSRLMRVRNGRTLQLCPTITVTHQPDGLYSAGYGTHVKCASQL